MAVIRWRGPFREQFSEFRDLNRLQDEVNRLYDSFFGKSHFSNRTNVFPASNVSEDHDNIYASAELPGVGPDDVNITVEEQSLSIKGARKIEREGEGLSYHRREREGGDFNRKINLPTRVATDKVYAETKEGILTIVMPKADEVKPKTIDIKVR